ncbi:MAG: hypothetical protein WEB87_05720, partial [Bacteriovoracaceae bacterium]
MRFLILSAIFSAAAFAGSYVQLQEEASVTPENINLKQVGDSTIKDKGASLIFSLAALQTQEVENFGDVDDSPLRDPDTGYGVLVEGNWVDSFGTEIGFLRMNKQYSVTEQGSAVVEEVDRLHVPVLAKFWPTDYLSLGVGAYADFAISDVNRSVEGDQSVDADTSAQTTVYGGQASATLNLAINNKTGIFVEGRWSEPFWRENGE